MFGLRKKQRPAPGDELRAALGDYELPTFPGVVVKALQVLRDDGAPASAVGDAVASDPGISTRLLSTVNSAAFSLRHRVRSVHHAVSILGRGEVESMLISMGVRETLPATAAGFDAGAFWTTSARRAVIARSLADALDPRTGSESFTAGLLQDMAIPLLVERQGEAYVKVLAESLRGEEDLPALEREAFGWDHAAVASGMCERWQFPPPIHRAIATHHDDTDPDDLPATRLVALMRSATDDVGLERLVETAHARHGMPRDRVAAIVAESAGPAEELARLFTGG